MTQLAVVVLPTTLRAAATATPASMAVPPAASTRIPACAASGWAQATIPWVPAEDLEVRISGSRKRTATGRDWRLWNATVSIGAGRTSDGRPESPTLRVGLREGRRRLDWPQALGQHAQPPVPLLCVPRRARFGARHCVQNSPLQRNAPAVRLTPKQRQDNGAPEGLPSGRDLSHRCGQWVMADAGVARAITSAHQPAPRLIYYRHSGYRKKLGAGNNTEIYTRKSVG